MFGLIDPPGPFAPAAEWGQFLERMLRLPQGEPQVQGAIREAREALVRAERGSVATTARARSAPSLRRFLPFTAEDRDN